MHNCSNVQVFFHCIKRLIDCFYLCANTLVRENRCVKNCQPRRQYNKIHTDETRAKYVNICGRITTSLKVQDSRIANLQ